MDDYTFRIIGIDPSLTNLGFAVLDVDVRTNRAVMVHAETIDGKKYPKKYEHIAEVYGDRYAKAVGMGESLLDLLHKWEPHQVITEQPYLGKFANAFGSLTEAIMVIKNSVLAYDPNMPLHAVDPPTIKNAVGVGGKSGKKEQMMAAVQKLTGVTNADYIDMASLDEHSCDSIAMAYWSFKNNFLESEV